MSHASSAMIPQRPRFDTLSFIKYHSSTGRAYRRQATELVSICRTFIQAQVQTFNPDARRSLTAVLHAADDVLKTVSEAGTKTSDQADEKLKWVAEVLHGYEADWCSRFSGSSGLNIKERMATAKAKDGSTLSFLNLLKEKLRAQPVLGERLKPTKAVEFILLRSLADNEPISVIQLLSEGSNISEVLLNFSHYKDSRQRITLEQNPRFYSDLPRNFGDDFQCDPIEDFLHTPGHKIFVLTDATPGRIYLESGQVSRAFCNVWRPQKSLIFKDVYGRLEGESIAGSSINGKPYLEYRVERLSSPISADSEDWIPVQDWIDPIRRLSDLGHLAISDIRIRTDPEMSGPSKPRVLPSAFDHKSSGSSKLRKEDYSRNAPSSLALTQVTQPRPAVPVGTNHGTEDSPPPALTLARRPLAPPNITPERHPQVSRETLDLSLGVGISSPSSPSVAVTASSGVKNSHHAGSSENVPGHGPQGRLYDATRAHDSALANATSSAPSVADLDQESLEGGVDLMLRMCFCLRSRRRSKGRPERP